MNTFSTYSLNFNNLTIKHKDVVDIDEWSDLVYENDGSFMRDFQYICFDCDGIEVVVDYSLEVEGSISHSSGDYWTPSYTEVEIDNVNININSLNIDEYDVLLNDTLVNTLKIEIKKQIM